MNSLSLGSFWTSRCLLWCRVVEGSYNNKQTSAQHTVPDILGTTLTFLVAHMPLYYVLNKNASGLSL